MIAAPDLRKNDKLNPRLENPIETVAARIQALPQSVRWLYPQDGLIQATAFGFALRRGFWSRLADRLVTLSSHSPLTRILAAVVNLSLLMVIYARQSVVRRLPADGALLVGIGALREPKLVRQLEAMQGMPVLHLNETQPVHFFRQAHVPLLALLREMRLVWSEAWQHLHPSQPLAGPDRVYLMSFLLMRGHRFAHMRAWFRQYLRRPGAVPAVAWTTTSFLAHAAVSAGVETIHMEHGFQRRSLIYPDFARSVCFNGFDADQIRRRLPKCAVTVVPEPMQPLATRRVVAVAGIFWKPDGFDLIRPFIAWALRSGLPVIVRKHPADTSDYWEQWRGVAGIEIAERDGIFMEFLDRVRPRMLATWYSTALYDAIVRGIVPVTVTPADHEAALDTVFPFRELSLCWPEHEATAQKLLDDDDLRAGYVADAYSRTMAMHSGAGSGASGL